METIKIGFTENTDGEKKISELAKKDYDVYQEKRQKSWLITFCGTFITTVGTIVVANFVCPVILEVLAAALMTSMALVVTAFVSPKFRNSKIVRTLSNSFWNNINKAYDAIDHNIDKKIFSPGKGVINTAYSKSNMVSLGHYFSLQESLEQFMKGIEDTDEIFDVNGNRIATIEHTHGLVINGDRVDPLKMDIDTAKIVEEKIEEGTEEIDEINDLKSSIEDDEGEFDEDIIESFKKINDSFTNININFDKLTKADYKKILKILGEIENEQISDIDEYALDETDEETMAELAEKQAQFNEAYQVHNEGPVKTLTIFKAKSKEQEDD